MTPFLEKKNREIVFNTHFELSKGEDFADHGSTPYLAFTQGSIPWEPIAHGFAAPTRVISPLFFSAPNPFPFFSK
jgi:hypothetical protein